MAPKATAGTSLQAVGGNADVNGLRIYFETHGSGRAGTAPLILLHGGVGASEMFAPIVPPLAKERQVVAVHLQGHGHTDGADRPLRFETMADDLAALLAGLGIDSADLLGYSLGGGVALQTAIRHPAAVRKLVLVSTPVKRQGFYPEVLQDMARMGPETAQFMGQSPLAQLYPGKDWAALFGGLADLLRREYDWSKEVAAIKAPIFAIYADADAIKPAHMLEVWELLGGGRRDAGLDGSQRPAARLAVVPGMTHYDVLTFPELAKMVSSFLEDPLRG